MTWDVNVYNQASMNHSLGICNTDQKLWWPPRNWACGVSISLHSKPGFPHFTSLSSLTLIDPAVQEHWALPKPPPPVILLVCSFIFLFFFTFIPFFICSSLSHVSAFYLFIWREATWSDFCDQTLHLVKLPRHPSVLLFPSPIIFSVTSFSPFFWWRQQLLCNESWLTLLGSWVKAEGH